MGIGRRKASRPGDKLAGVFDRVRTGVRDYEPARAEKERDAHSEGNRANGWAQSGSSSVDKKREQGRPPGPCCISDNSWETPCGGIGEAIGRSCFSDITPPLRGSRGVKGAARRRTGGGRNRGTKGTSLPVLYPAYCWTFPSCAIRNRDDKVAVTRSRCRERSWCLRSPWIASAKSMNEAASWSPCFGTRTFTLPPENSV